MTTTQYKPTCQHVYDSLIQLISTKRHRVYRPDIEFSFTRATTVRVDDTYGEWVSEKLFEKVYKDVGILGNLHYIRKIIFRTPFNAEIYTVAYNNVYSNEEDYINQPFQNYKQHCHNDLVRFDWVNQRANCDRLTDEIRSEQSKSLDIQNSMAETFKIQLDHVTEKSRKLEELATSQGLKLAKFCDLAERYGQLKDDYEIQSNDLDSSMIEVDQLTDRCAQSEDEYQNRRIALEESTYEIERLNTMNLELQTELTATRVANYCLDSPEEVERVGNMSVKNKQMRSKINALETEVRNKRVEIKILKNKLYFVRGQKDMIREVLNGGTLVVHREAHN